MADGYGTGGQAADNGGGGGEAQATRRRMTPRPTRAYIEALAAWVGGSLSSSAGGTSLTGSATNAGQHGGGFWSTFYREVETDLRFIRREYIPEVLGDPKAPNFPDGYVIHIPPTAGDKMRQSVDQVFVGDCEYTVEMPHGFRSDAKRAELEQLFTKACYGWHNTEERDTDTSPLNDVKHNAIGLGLSVLSTVIDLSKYPERPERRKGEKRAAWEGRQAEWKRARRAAGSSVFATRSIHPLNVAYDRQHSPPQWMLIREGIDGWTAAQEYPAWRGAADYTQPSPASPLLTMARYWSPDWTGCWINGDPALGPEDGADSDGIAPNPYGFIPAWPAAGGHGHQDPAMRPEWELQGIVRAARDLFIEEAVIYNLEGVYLRRASYGPQDVISGPEDPQRVQRIARELKGGPGVVPHLPPGYSITSINPSPLPDVVLQLDRKNDLLIDRSTIYDVSAGSGSPTEPAARTRVRLQQIDKALADAALHIEQAREAEMTARFQMIKHVLKGPVGVNVPRQGLPAEYVEIDPDDIPDGLVVKVKLVGETEEEKARKQDMLDRRLNSPKPTLDLLSYLKRVGEADPEGIIRGLHMDVLRPLATELLMMIARGQLPQMLAGVAEEAGIRYTPEELATASMRAGVAEAVAGAAPATGEGGAGGGSAGTPMQGQGQMQMNGAGAALPGTPYTPAESGVSDNPQVSRPDSPEAMQQRMRLERRGG